LRVSNNGRIFALAFGQNQGIQKKEFFEEITYMRVVQEACIFLSLGRR